MFRRASTFHTLETELLILFITAESSEHGRAASDVFNGTADTTGQILTHHEV